MRRESREGERLQAAGQLSSPVSQQAGRWSVTLSSGPSKRSPNHINHRLTLGSSPKPSLLYSNEELNAQVAL